MTPEQKKKKKRPTDRPTVFRKKKGIGAWLCDQVRQQQLIMSLRLYTVHQRTQSWWRWRLQKIRILCDSYSCSILLNEGSVSGQSGSIGCLGIIWLGVGFLAVCFRNMQSQFTKNYLLWEEKKKWPKCHFLAQFFLGWVGLGFLGSLVGFIIILICFSDPIELVNRKPPSIHCTAVVLIALTFWMHD